MGRKTSSITGIIVPLAAIVFIAAVAYSFFMPQSTTTVPSGTDSQYTQLCDLPSAPTHI